MRANAETNTDMGARPKRRLAMLVDGDNAQPKLIEIIIQEASRHGTLTIKRIYGDWTQQSMNSWKQHLHEHAIQPIQQFRNTVGKNATDSALIIDAMDIMHSGQVEGVAIISSDSDYTRLATRLREHGLFVMGIGERKTPEAFVNSCEIFTFTENLRGDDEEPERRQARAPTDKRAPRPGPEKAGKERPLLKLLVRAYNMAALDDGWAHLSQLRENLSKLDPSFDPRTYGFRQMLPLIKAQTAFELKEKDASVLVRMKE
jgi:uncharacterized LabA/DUF88 family protein